MKKTSLWIAGICVLALGFSVAVYAVPQGGTNLSGTWTLTVTPAPGSPTPGAGGGQGAAAGAPGAAAGQGGGGGRGAGRGPAGPPTITFAQDGTKLTGALAGGRGPGVPIQGTVSGDTVKWTAARRLSDGIPRDATYKATVSGDTMSGTIDEPTVDPTQGYSEQFTAKRNASAQ